MEKIPVYVYKNKETGKYHKFDNKSIDVNIEDADKYNFHTGLITISNNYKRVNYEDELILIRKEKLIKLKNL